jgi:hypothetical protein
MQGSLKSLAPQDPAAAAAQAAALDAVQRLRSAMESMLGNLATAPDRAMAVSVPFLKLCGLAIGGWLMARGADVAATRLAAGGGDKDFFRAKLASAHFYATQVLSQVLTLEHVVKHGSDAVVGTDAALI